MAEILTKSKKLQYKLHKFESKCLQKCIMFQSKLNLKQPINSNIGNPRVKHFFNEKNQNLKLFDETNDSISDIDAIINRQGNANQSSINVTKQSFPINLSILKHQGFYSEKASFLLEIELDSNCNKDINTFKHISEDFAKFNFELVCNVSYFIMFRLEVMIFKYLIPI